MYMKDEKEHRESLSLVEFLSAQKWHLAEDHKDKGISWTELLILYEITGFKWSQTKEGQREQLEEQLSKGQPMARRWQRLFGSKGK